MKELWKRIDWIEEDIYPYEVSSLGRVRSLPKHIVFADNKIKFYPSRILKPVKYREGYLHLNLFYGTGKYVTVDVHILVATAFVPNPFYKKQVNHKEGKKYDNRAIMLEWATPSENVIHAYKTGLMKKRKHLKLAA